MLLIVGSPSLRRNLLDALVAQREPTAAAVMSTYQRTLTQRNSLLRRIREEEADRAELPYWDGGHHRERRAHPRLAPRDARRPWRQPLAEAHREIAPEESDLRLRYSSNVEPGAGESNEAALRRRLRETADKEVWNGATLVGPHRDDFVFVSEGRELTEFASRGQQRTAILALKLAELDVLTQLDGRPPLLLLDDVFSELDPERRAHLVRRIGDLPQAIVTTTTPDDLDPALVAASTLWHVEPGSGRRSTSPPREQPQAAGPPPRRPAAGHRHASSGSTRSCEAARGVASWTRIVEELVPAAAGASTPARGAPAAAHRLGGRRSDRARSCACARAELLEAFASAPGGQRLRELHVVVRRPPGRDSAEPR